MKDHDTVCIDIWIRILLCPVILYPDPQLLAMTITMDTIITIKDHDPVRIDIWIQILLCPFNLNDQFMLRIGSGIFLCPVNLYPDP